MSRNILSTMPPEILTRLGGFVLHEDGLSTSKDIANRQGYNISYFFNTFLHLKHSLNFKGR
eukprot:4865202-Pleurochrysis_carterae.AAC.1